MDISSINDRLRIAKIGVTIEQHGDRLHLRGTFPPKPGNSRSIPFQQRISLGVKANAAGLKYAEGLAKEIGGLLAQDKFCWDAFLIPDRSPVETVGGAIDKFRLDYFHRRGETAAVLTTYKSNYQAVFSRLDLDEPPNADHLYRQIIDLSRPNTRSRKRFCQAINALARFSGWNFDFKSLQGNYSPKAVRPRDLPDDKTIATLIDTIPNPSWRWAYGMMATFGVRNHEIFFIRPEQLRASGICEVENGKTGQRRVWALYPEWLDRFGLLEVRKPDCSGKTHADYGARVSKAFKRYEIPFTPYTLRHCWAVRSLEFGLDISLAAAQMGHSVLVHSQTYHHWISDRTHQRAYDILINRDDRPLPP